jgi:hypothetical protein
MFEQIKKLSFSDDRDVALKQLVEYGLANDRPDAVVRYVEMLSFTADRDMMYKAVIDRALRIRMFDVAEAAIEALSFSSDRDDARTKLIRAKTTKMVE